MALGTTKVWHLSFVVRDLETVIGNWAELLDVPVPEIMQVPAAEEAPAYTDDRLGDYTDCRIAVLEMENIKMEFVQPGESDSPWKDFLKKEGEGLQHISFLVPDSKEAKAALNEKLGIHDPYHIGFYPDGTYAFYSTKDKLGTELNIKSEESNTDLIKRILANREKPLSELQ